MTGSDEFIVRRAVDADAAAVAEVWLRSYSAALPTVQRAHTDDEVREWFRTVVVPGPRLETWVAVADGRVVGLLVLSDDDLEQLYLDPDFRGRGLGDRLVELAKRLRPRGLQLWTFQVNGPARRFYQRHGFEVAELTDGRDNEEREPDVRYVWRPPVSTSQLPDDVQRVVDVPTDVGLRREDVPDDAVAVDDVGGPAGDEAE